MTGEQAIPKAVRRARLVASFARTWIRAPDGPVRLVLSVTRRCNLRCEMCRSWRTEGGRELTPAEVGGVLSEMPDLVSLDLTGGEPFMRTDIDEVAAAVLRFAPRLRVLHFTTNGWFTPRTLEVTREVARARPDVQIVPTISIDGPAGTHDRLRGREGSFERALETFLELRRLPGIRPQIGTTITPFNASEVEELGDVLCRRVPSFEQSSWHWNWLQVSPHFFDNLDLAGIEVEAPAGLLRRHLLRRGVPRSLLQLLESFFIINLEFFLRGEPVGLSCQAMRSTAFISSEGMLYPCHVFDRPMGDVREGFAKLFGSPQALRVRAEVERLACGGCFTPCEAYSMIAGSPFSAARLTAARALRMAAEGLRSRATDGEHPGDNSTVGGSKR